MKIHLCTPYFRSANDDRQAEFDQCLVGNIANPLIDEITLFVDDAHAPSIEHHKVRIVDIEGRLTYRDWLEFALSLPERHISVLSNTDILFDDTVSKLKSVFEQDDRFVALSRHEKLSDSLKPHPDPKWSQDVWAIETGSTVTPEFAKAVDFPLGVPRCDNKIIYEAAIHGWNVINPFPSVRAIHLHESQFRSYHKTFDRTLIGGMGFASACPDLMGQSKVELSVWPLKTQNISGVRVISSLEKWGASDDEISGDEPPRIVAYNNDWQFPAITEKHAFDSISEVSSLIPKDAAYLGFPWATLVDKLINCPSETGYLLSELERLSRSVSDRVKVVTVNQHIHMLRYQKVIADSGVTDIFWSHKVAGQDHLPKYPNVRLHAFPLYPVQLPDTDLDTDDSDRDLLFSFVGARARDFYLSQVRNHIIDELADDPDGHIVARETWHYNKIVYDHQILKSTEPPDQLVDHEASSEFVDVLKRSKFSLCPSGSGPNSIRLWESIGAGAVPVIMADTLELPGPRVLWEQAAVFCEETRDAVRALPDKLRAMAFDTEVMEAKRHAMTQLWSLYGPDAFVSDILNDFSGTSAGQSVEGERDLVMSDGDFLKLASEIRGQSKRTEAEFFMLLSATSHALTRPKSFLRLYQRFEGFRKALETAANRCRDHQSAKAWQQAFQQLKCVSDTGDRALADPVLSVMITGRNANRSPFTYEAYQQGFASALQFVDRPEQADLLVFGASANIREHYAEALKGRPDVPKDRLVVLSEEPLWDTTWGYEFDQAHVTIDFWKHQFGYAVLNHMTTDIFAFDKLPYFVTTDPRYTTRYARMFRRNAALSAPELVELWKKAPVRQAYFAERRDDGRYDFERPDLDLFGYCAYRTRIAEAAPSNGVLRVGQGWSDTARRQELPDWHLDKLTTLDRRTFICSALENTHLPDYVTEKPFDAFAVLGVPVYAANSAHRIHEIVPEGSFINVWGMTANEAAEHLKSFEPDLEFAERYLEAQKRLAALFGDVEILRAERRRVVDATVRALESVRRGEFRGRRGGGS